ncbi:NUDIX hydrolase domain-like protein [Kockovaella imperatae]|uniref:NUDIX hydrolase domain-like protein n=1 Tax=Kockovaella imperatae TaxID=4999 RepID=A0A1Y1U7F2_9TREE|nr:NUDIX hydrolase domain-like protein [Kockovaella imperatae]ORX33938.1 NUDIX hydrolase domain-like protein [Kockovaella imperatae]
MRTIRSALKYPPKHSPADCPPHTVEVGARPPSEAAILLPLMNIQGEPCILLSRRSEKLRVHAGEVSFPGGKADPTDANLAAAAMREAEEELGIPVENVELLGMLEPPEYSLGNRARVWAFVGFVHDRPFDILNSATQFRSQKVGPLTSLSLSDLKPSTSEVSGLIPFPLFLLADKESDRRSLHFFRMDPGKPYWKYKVGDLFVNTDGTGQSIEGLRSDKCEVWGLSGWFLHRLLKRMGLTEDPVMAQIRSETGTETQGNLTYT